MNKILVVSILSLLMVACGKTVSKDNGPGLTITPPSNPDNGGGTDAPAPVPVTPNLSGIITMNFSNHGEVGSSDNIETPFEFQEDLLLTIPSSPSSITYVSASLHYPITLKINNAYVCSYVWNGQKYVKHSSCLNEVVVQSGDEIVVSDIPQGGQTVTFKLIYQK